MSETHDRSPSRVLAVEDNAGDVRLVKEGIELATPDVELEVVNTGSRAIERLSEVQNGNTRPPQLILLDLNLPGQSGFDVLDAIRSDESLRNVPVIVASSSENPEDVDRAYEQSANAYVSKPADPDEYIQMVASVAEFWIASLNHPNP